LQIGNVDGRFRGRDCAPSGDPLLQKERTVQVSRLDLACELRLRRWARMNYVSADRRPISWHPIVLAEMLSRDAELAAIAEPIPAGARYVPLAPTVAVGTASKLPAEID
jgi:hypothetical protein